MAYRNFARVGCLLAVIVVGESLTPNCLLSRGNEPEMVPPAEAKELASQVAAAIRENFARLPTFQLSSRHVMRWDPPKTARSVSIRQTRGGTYSLSYHWAEEIVDRVLYLGPDGDFRCDQFDARGNLTAALRRSSGTTWVFDAIHAGARLEQYLPDARVVATPQWDPRYAGMALVAPKSLADLLEPARGVQVEANWISSDGKDDTLELTYRQGIRRPRIIVCSARNGLLPVRVEERELDDSLRVETIEYQTVGSAQLPKKWIWRTYLPGSHRPDDSGWRQSCENEYTVVAQAPTFAEGTFAPPAAATSPVPLINDEPADRSPPSAKPIAAKTILGLAIAASLILILFWRRRKAPTEKPAVSGDDRRRGLRVGWRFRFTLRTMLLALTACCVVLGIAANRAHRIRRLCQLVQDCGGKAWFTGQLDPMGLPLAEARSVGPEWIRNWLGVEYVDAIAAIDLSGATVSDELWEKLADADRLQSLRLANTATTDARLDGLRELSSLRELDLTETSVTDEGLDAIAKLTGLTSLWLYHCDVSSAGLAKLTTLPIETLGLSAWSIGEPHGDLLDDFPRLRRVYFSRQSSGEPTKIEFIEAALGFPGTAVAFVDKPPRGVRRGGVRRLDPEMLATIGSIDADASPDELLARGVLLDYLGADRDSRKRATQLFLAAIPASKTPAKIWILCADSKPHSAAVIEAKRTVAEYALDRSLLNLLNRMLATGETRVACLAAALAREPDSRDAWFAAALTLRGKLRRDALDAWTERDEMNAAPCYFAACVAIWERNAEAYRTALREGNSRPEFSIPAFLWPDAGSLERLRGAALAWQNPPPGLDTNVQSQWAQGKSFLKWSETEFSVDGENLQKELRLRCVSIAQRIGLEEDDAHRAAMRIAKSNGSVEGIEFAFWLQLGAAFAWVDAECIQVALGPSSYDAVDYLRFASPWTASPDAPQFQAYQLGGPVDVLACVDKFRKNRWDIAADRFYWALNRLGKLVVGQRKHAE